MSGIRMRQATLVASLLLAGTLATGLAATAQSRPAAKAASAAQETFSTPQDALAALSSAVQSKDRVALARLFGPDDSQLLSGDRVEDARALDRFATALGQAGQLQKAGEDQYTVLVGNDHWPMPIPIVQRQGRWLFDTQAGLNEILNRRIGQNELAAITTCRAYVLAQWEYFTEGDHDNDGVAEYAQRFMSTPGTHDGLYWETGPDETPSPLGALVAEARAEGYRARPRAQTAVANRARRGPAADQTPRYPFHGYFFKILTRQGTHAPGGAYNYIINGNMIAGYALVAYPAKWGNSGVMTFIVNQQGRVYQKNLGPNTLAVASAMTAYNPDQSWQLVGNF